ncbi:Na+/H+ antiporter [Marinitoga sp. 1135]|uniref:Na+/H+ antiporter n=1 Tax=Marinitoga piezophila (strain DSM 14283 / JCM 11233 / KA3) TaxID=443254 RepID=H2J839_MARPK|nr:MULTISPECIES: Na+/H+ antiporter NhaC family protein [Marinitoga]AEX85530.1 Na+/H+ antiporter [Marinitoga piezophila KA3]APT75996.1 Na+/H+ antiporter [Marinitoga sp. 1137]NUU95740.1 Na+/H+ antiporter [Marinitoga sp. 1135]NUU97668.1 Na+/H+ antiporter [Marinitoga sp. 1138]
MRKRRLVALFIMAAFIMLATMAFAAGGDAEAVNYGFWSIIPPLLAIVLAFVTKEVILSLLLGVFSGALISVFATSNSGFFMKLIESYTKTFEYPVNALADSWHAGIIVFTLTIGGMVGVIAKMGGTRAIANALAKKAQTARSAQLATALMGVVVFFDDYANTLIVGPTMRPLTDKLRVSREKLSYIVDSTAAPVATMAAISTWIGYELGLIGDAFKSLGVEVNPYSVFFQSIPYRMYGIFALVMVFMVGAMMRDFGPMYEAEKRARLTGKVLADGAEPMLSTDFEKDLESKNIPLRVSNALVPILTLVIFAFIGLWYSGGGLEQPFTWDGIRDAFGNADASAALIWASALASIVAVVMAISQNIMTLKEALEAWVEGAKSLVITTIILILAWSIGSIASDLGTAEYLVQVISSSLPSWTIPVLVFVISAIVAFATGTSWGTMAIMLPLAVPLAAAYTGGEPSTLVYATLGAVLTGSTFGDHCSPISDTTIMSSMASSADHIDHVKTQLPYALTAAGLAAVVGYIPVGLGMPVWLSLILGVAGIWAILKFYGKSTDPKDLKA